MYIDIKLPILNPLSIYCDTKILLLGANRPFISNFVNKFLCNNLLNHTILTKDPQLKRFLNKNNLSNKSINIYDRISQLLIKRCFLDNWFLYIDTDEYSPFSNELIINNINKKQLLIVNETDFNEISYLDPLASGTKINFDYIFLLESDLIKSDFIKKVLGLDTIANVLKPGEPETLLTYNDLKLLVNEIDISNKINEKIYLVVDVKNSKLCYFTF
jgi:hypothetical protein